MVKVSKERGDMTRRKKTKFLTFLLALKFVKAF